MVSIGEVLNLGVLPERVGLYFASMQLLVDAYNRSQGETAELLHRQLTRRHSQMGKTVAEVEQTEALLQRLGIQLASRPQMPAECVAWQQKIYLVVQGALATNQPALATYHLLGQLCGQAWLTLQLGGLVLSLRCEMPKDESLKTHAAALAAEQQRLYGVLMRIAEHPQWSAPFAERLMDLRAAFGQVPLVAADPAERSETEDAASARLIDLLPAMDTFADRLSALESALG